VQNQGQSIIRMRVKAFALVLVFSATLARAWHGEDVPGSCEALCRAAGDQCSTPWIEEKTTCLLSFPDTDVQPDSLQHGTFIKQQSAGIGEPPDSFRQIFA
jgi:hypothetical protein